MNLASGSLSFPLAVEMFRRTPFEFDATEWAVRVYPLAEYGQRLCSVWKGVCLDDSEGHVSIKGESPLRMQLLLLNMMNGILNLTKSTKSVTRSSPDLGWCKTIFEEGLRCFGPYTRTWTGEMWIEVQEKFQIWIRLGVYSNRGLTVLAKEWGDEAYARLEGCLSPAVTVIAEVAPAPHSLISALSALGDLTKKSTAQFRCAEQHILWGRVGTIGDDESEEERTAVAMLDSSKLPAEDWKNALECFKCAETAIDKSTKALKFAIKASAEWIDESKSLSESAFSVPLLDVVRGEEDAEHQ
eukprot:TRINITY_DN144447_c0_g1_i1.p1 TRINITY_DN144447_c0_g1~~TRINITY_DN144447_c0_g1_i1.p1  ORF type:complete len:299 (+),score=25.79 TRINITY_DN144447_c0_g1_i1:132-1028(+)